MFKKIECVAGKPYASKDFVAALQQLQYAKKEFIENPGEFSVRGSYVDIYPYYFKNPLRFEFVFGYLESIRDFIVTDGSLGESYRTMTIVPVNKAMPSNKASDMTEEDFSVSFFDFQKNDYVVHFDYGIGKYLGVKKIKVKGVSTAYHAIEYANNEILYVELDKKSLIEKYIGAEGRKPKFTKLHSKEWKKTKERTKLALKNYARDLILVQAKRDLLKGFKFAKDNEWQKDFERQFPYKETPDQDKAIKEVKADMESNRPMDRLICGDVGYGKTEVAMRAAFKAVMSGKQVAFLVPTTILAEQHYMNLKERLGDFPFNVNVLSRFRTRKEQLGIVKQIEKGECDIVVGTHRLLSKDIKFVNLGLVIIDEEQRFGVAHKEKLKQMRSQIDVLTLTATPIPRTLYMSLMGVRDMSVINTPPTTRLSVATEVLEYNHRMIKEAIQREMDRGGQVFFVHNRVQSIEKVYDELKQLLPHVKFCVAHGQMSPKMLEQIMIDFVDHKFDCLIATSIIESGIDIPNANTMIVDRADLFGLSDLYQLRGRVGRFRGKRKAYAYFLIPKGFLYADDSGKRLSAIEKFTELGSGFKIAMEDLEIRGAGNIVGHQQSGYIHQVGFDLYCKLLKQAIEEEKKTKKKIQAN